MVGYWFATVGLSRKRIVHSPHIPLATHCCSASATNYFDACSRCRTLPTAWSQAPVGVTTSRQCYGSCTGCQSVSALCSRSRGSCISRLSDWLPRTSQTTVAFCRTLVVAHCGPIPMTFGSCLFHEHITNSVIGVSQPPVLNCGTTFHLDSGGRDYTFDSFRQSLKTHLFGDRSA